MNLYLRWVNIRLATYSRTWIWRLRVYKAISLAYYLLGKYENGVEVYDIGNQPRGLPRPLLNGLPLAYTSQGHHGRVDPSRQFECSSKGLCLVCGEKLAGTAIVIVNEVGDVFDAGGLHEGCARVTVNLCPAIKSGLADRTLTVQEIPTSNLLENVSSTHNWKDEPVVTLSSNGLDRSDLVRGSKLAV